MSLWCLEHLFSHQIDKIMTHLHYSENSVITSCNPTVKRAENKLVSTVTQVVQASKRQRRAERELDQVTCPDEY